MANLTVEEKSMVVSVSHFFEKEKDTRVLINVNKVIGRTAEASCVSEPTVVRCRREDMLKTELYDLVKKHKPEAEYVCDRMALEQGFIVVRLPPYHCIFNPIELGLDQGESCKGQQHF